MDLVRASNIVGAGISHAAALDEQAAAAMQRLAHGSTRSEALARANGAADEQRGLANVVGELWPFSGDGVVALRQGSDQLDRAVEGVRQLSGRSGAAKLSPAHLAASRRARKELHAALARAQSMGHEATETFGKLARTGVAPRSRQVWDEAELLAHRRLGAEALVRHLPQHDAASLARTIEHAAASAAADPAARVPVDPAAVRRTAEEIASFSRSGRSLPTRSFGPQEARLGEKVQVEGSEAGQQLWAEKIGMGKRPRHLQRLIRDSDSTTWDTVRQGVATTFRWDKVRQGYAERYVGVPGVAQMAEAGQQLRARADALLRERWDPAVAELVEAVEARTPASQAPADVVLAALHAATRQHEQAAYGSAAATRPLLELVRKGAPDESITGAMDAAGAAYLDEARAVQQLEQALNQVPGAQASSLTKDWSWPQRLNEHAARLRAATPE